MYCWWQVKLLVLTVPVQVITWILEEAQINGEAFTMGGRPMRLEKVSCPEEELHEDKEETKEGPEEGRKVIHLGKRRHSKEEKR